SSIGAIARVSDWTWQPELRQPITCAVLYPFSLLPAGWLPFALNLFTAICAAVALTLLARSVALLLGAVGSPSLAEVGKLADCGTVGPPRSTSAGEVGRDRQALPGLPIAPLRISWVAPVLAVTLCGLQLSFWEHATAFTGEMIDLLIFA